MSFAINDKVTIAGRYGVHSIDKIEHRYCESLGRTYYKFKLDNGKECWGNELKLYIPSRAALWFTAHNKDHKRGLI